MSLLTPQIKQFIAENQLRTPEDVHDAQELITSRRQSMHDGLTLWQRRAKKIAARLTALKQDHPDSRRIPGLERKLLRQQEHVAFYQRHVTDKTFPPVIFGTRQLFLEHFHTLADPLAELQRQKVWKERWDEGRNELGLRWPNHVRHNNAYMPR